jgi:hypothetical protein
MRVGIEEKIRRGKGGQTVKQAVRKTMRMKTTMIYTHILNEEGERCSGSEAYRQWQTPPGVPPHAGAERQTRPSEIPSLPDRHILTVFNFRYIFASQAGRNFYACSPYYQQP